MKSHEKPQLRLFMAKAFGYSRALANLQPEERSQYASVSVTEDYNNFIDALGSLIEGGDLPPKLTMGALDSGHPCSIERLNELYIFCEQIYQMLATLEDDGD